MSRISVELVPRNKAFFEAELKLLKGHFPSVDTINVPDITKYDLSGIEAAVLAKRTFEKTIPHIRACNVDRKAISSFIRHIERSGITEMLVIRGDEAKDSSDTTSLSSLELISELKNRMREIKIYAGLDQYRSDINEELLYARRKLEVGADGFFTQPFFDLEYLKRYMKALDGIEVFWGVSPVTSQRSKDYWERVNKATFPETFRCDIAWNRSFAQEVLEQVRKEKANIYFMPIKTDILDYFTGLI